MVHETCGAVSNRGGLVILNSAIVETPGMMRWRIGMITSEKSRYTSLAWDTASARRLSDRDGPDTTPITAPHNLIKRVSVVNAAFT
jgi:hypothetical protein